MKGDFKRLMGYIRPYASIVAGTLALGLVIAGCTGAVAYALRPLLDQVFIEKDSAMLAWLPWAVLAVVFIKTTSAYVQAVAVEILGSRVLMDIRNDFYEAMLALPVARFSSTSSGEFVSRMTNDVNQVQRAVGILVKDLIQNSVTALVLVGVIFYQDVTLAFIALGVLPLAFYPLIRLSKRLRKRALEGQEAVSILTQVLTETLGGIRVVKAFVAEGRELARFGHANRVYRSLVVKVARVARIPGPMMEFVGALGIVSVMAYGGARVIQGETTPGAFFSFAAACMMLYGPLRALTQTNAILQQVLVSARRIFEVMDLPGEEPVDRVRPAISGIREAMVFDHVGHVYSGEGEAAVSDVSLTARVGDVIALVGPSGAGKTTLVNLIPRFLEPTSGNITIDGVNTGEVSLSSLRGLIGIVGQDTVLFDDTIGANIAYGAGDGDATQEAIEDAARRAHAHGFIGELPHGYDTRVGERGVMLSGGQRQRIAIARAILRDAPILILDEATSALDSESERHVQAALAELMAERTTFVIAHRLATVRHATRIVAMDGGRVVESGTHDELLAKGGLYRKLHDLQFQTAKGG